MQHIPSRKIYYLKFKPVLLLISLLNLFLAIFYLFDPARNLAFFFLFICTLMFLMAKFNFIEVSPTGIRYHDVTFQSIESSWENIEKIDVVAFHLYEHKNCIILKKSVKVKWWVNLFEFLTPFALRGKIIPFSHKLWSNFDELEQSVKHYTPNISWPS